MSETVTRQIGRGSVWMLLFKLLDRGIAIISTAILARILTPNDFGVMAMAMSIVGAAELLKSFGFDLALIRDASVSRARFDSAWTLQVALSSTCACCVLLLSAPAVEIFHDDRLATILPVLASGLFLGGFENIGVVSFRRELNFRSEFRFVIAKRLLATAMTVSLVIWSGSYWGLVIGYVLSQCGNVVISFVFHPYRPWWCLTEARSLFNYSKWLLANNAMAFLVDRVPDFVIGRFVGASALGLYNSASEISRIPTTELSAPINRAAYPGYTKHANSIDALADTYLRTLGWILCLTLPATVGVFVVAQPFVMLLFGPQWLANVPIVRVLAVVGLLTSLTGNSFYVYIALAQNRVTTLLASVRLVLFLVGSLYLVQRMGALGVAVACLASAMINIIASMAVLRKVVGISVRRLSLVAWRPFLSSMVMLVVQWTLLDGYLVASSETGAAMALVILIGSGVAIYGTALSLFWWVAGAPAGAERDAFSFIAETFWRARAMAFFKP